MKIKFALSIPIVIVLLLAAAFTYQQLRPSGTSSVCLEIKGREAEETFTAQYSPDEIATMVEGTDGNIPPGIAVPYGYALTPAPLRTPSLRDAVREYLFSPANVRRYGRPCTVTPTRPPGA